MLVLININKIKNYMYQNKKKSESILGINTLKFIRKPKLLAYLYQVYISLVINDFR